jgi:uncharacterized protein
MILNIKVKTNSKTDEIVFKDNMVIIKIKERPVDGKANEYLLKYFSKVFQLPQSAFEITAGKNNSFKRIRIDSDEIRIQEILSTLKLKN